MNLKDLKTKLLANKNFRKEYYGHDLAFDIGEMVIDLRVKLGITQDKLARLVGTKQSSIARLENGSQLPSLRFLEKIASQAGTYLLPPRFALLEEGQHVEDTNWVSANTMIKVDLRPEQSRTTLDQYLYQHNANTNEKIVQS